MDAGRGRGTSPSPVLPATTGLSALGVNALQYRASKLALMPHAAYFSLSEPANRVTDIFEFYADVFEVFTDLLELSVKEVKNRPQPHPTNKNPKPPRPKNNPNQLYNRTHRPIPR